jgi:hypothetical protein
MTVVLRALALIGSIGHAIDRVVGRVLGFLPFRAPGALIVAGLLAVAAWSTAQATTEELAARPQPAETTVSAIGADPDNAWVRVRGLLSGPFVDNSVYARDDFHVTIIRDEPHDHQRDPYGQINPPTGWRHQTVFVTGGEERAIRWFYVLRDPEDDAQALVVRSARDADTIRRRSVRATATGTADGLPLLAEIDDAGTDEPTATPADLAGGAAGTVRGVFTQGAERPCDNGPACVDGRTWRYLLTDADGVAAWIDSPHAINALPITLEGVTTSDARRMEVVMATDEMTAAVADLHVPASLVLEDGAGPLISEVTYLGAVSLASMAGLVVLSAAIGYPIFRRTRAGTRSDAPRPVVDELIPVTVDGRLPGFGGPQRLSGTAATLGWLPGGELARRAWHLRSAIAEITDDRPRLALMALEGAFVLPLDPIRDRLAMVEGQVATATGVRPALRVRGPNLSMLLSFASVVDRDRAARELDPSTPPAEMGPIPQHDAPPRPPAPRWVRPATVIALGVVAVTVVLSAGIGLVVGDASLVGALAALAAAGALAMLAAGVARGMSIALELLPSVALLGIVAAVLLAASSPGCASWLSPDFDGCTLLDMRRLVAPAVGVAAFALLLWATPQLARPRDC